MGKRTFLDFEQPIAELETKIEELRYVQAESAVDISEEIEQLSKKSQQLTKDIYSDLSPWQITKIARHIERPYTLDYISHLFTDFVEMHGDRHFADDLSIVGGLARFNGQPCMVPPGMKRLAQTMSQPLCAVSTMRSSMPALKSSSAGNTITYGAVLAAKPVITAACAPRERFLTNSTCKPG